MLEKIAVLYSIQQGAFHIETVGEYIKSNLICLFENKPTQYMMVGLFSTYEQADEQIKSLRQPI